MTATNEDITVVVVNHDYGEFLEEAVASARTQRGGEPRVLVVDDGSTDPHTLTVLDRLEGVVRLHRQANAGLAAARNAGLALADTRYLLVLDADDRLPVGALRAMREPLDASAGLGFAYGTMRFFGDWEGELRMPPYDAFRLLYRHTIGSTALMRSEVFRDTGGFDPSFRGYEDWEFWLHALRVGWRGRQVDAVTLDYRRHGSTMLSGARRDYDHWYRRLRAKHADVYRQRRELARDSGLGPLQRAVHRWYWGPRPIPARIEHAVYSGIFGSRDRSAG